MSADRDDDPETLPLTDDAALTLLAGALPPRAPSRAAREQLLSALRGRERFAPFVAEVSHAFGVGAEALRAAFARMTDDAAWQPGFWPGSRLLSTPELAAQHTVIARLAPGSHISSHGHPVRELTYVLDGTLTENDARSFGPGELLEMQPGSQHAIGVAGDSECLVVFGLARP